MPKSTSAKSCPACTTSSRNWPGSISPGNRWKSVRPHTMSWVVSGSNGETQMSTVHGLFAAGECAAGLHGANRLGGNSLSDLIVFGKLAGEHAARFAHPENGSVDVPAEVVADPRETPWRRWMKAARRTRPEGPIQVQYDLQELMQEQGRHYSPGRRNASGDRGH